MRDIPPPLTGPLQRSAVALKRRLPIMIVATMLMGLVAVGDAAINSEAAAAAPNRPVVYMTFDDGPDRVNTNRVLDTLAQYDATATFFVVGAQVQANVGVAQRIVADGHAIANHSYNHSQLTRLSDAAVLSQFTATNQAIAAATGVVPTCYRAPYGSVDARVHNMALQAGLTNADWTTSTGPDAHWGMWDVDTRDWERNLARTRGRLDSIQGGDVVLMHSLSAFSASVFADWMALNADRFTFAALPGCGTPTEPAVPEDASQWYRYQVARLYAAYFDRAPDYAGAQHWNTQFANRTLDLVGISNEFAASIEFQNRYQNLNDRRFVALVYRNVLNRAPDSEGLEFWTDELTNNGVSRGEMMIYFSESTEFVRASAEMVTGSAWNGDAESSYARGIDMNVLPGPED